MCAYYVLPTPCHSCATPISPLSLVNYSVMAPENRSWTALDSNPQSLNNSATHLPPTLRLHTLASPWDTPAPSGLSLNCLPPLPPWPQVYLGYTQQGTDPQMTWHGLRSFLLRVNLELAMKRLYEKCLANLCKWKCYFLK